MSLASQALAQAAPPTAIAVKHFDFSQLDLFLGLIIGIAAAGIITGLVIWALLKAGVFRVGSPSPPMVVAASQPCDGTPAEHILRLQIPRDCNAHKAEYERSKRNEDNILKLWGKYDEITTQLRDGIDALQQNQLTLLVGLVQGGILDPKLIPEGAGLGSLRGFRVPKGGS